MFPAQALAEALLARGAARGADHRSRAAPASATSLPGVDDLSHRRRLALRPADRSAIKGFAQLARGYLAVEAAAARGSRPNASSASAATRRAPTLLAASRLRLPDRRSTSRTRCSAAPTGCWRRASTPSRRRPTRSRASPTATAPRSSRPAIRCARRSSRCATIPIPRRSPDGELRLLVIGGSQGARILREVVPAGHRAAARDDARAALGRAAVPRRRTSRRCAHVYAANRRARELAPFFADMPERLCWRASGDRARRRLDRGRAGRRRPAGDPGALRRRHRRPPDRQCARAGRRGRRLDDARASRSRPESLAGAARILSAPAVDPRAARRRGRVSSASRTRPIGLPISSSDSRGGSERRRDRPGEPPAAGRTEALREIAA